MVTPQHLSSKFSQNAGISQEAPCGASLLQGHDKSPAIAEYPRCFQAAAVATRPRGVRLI